MSKELELFREFLATVPLVTYRRKYAHVKTVEMDLPKDIQAIELLYKIYWDEKRVLPFELFYKEYLRRKRETLEAFRQKITMCENCFYRGLEARIYRTWSAIITQIHGGYIAESVFGKGSVMMSEELDHQGADIRVTYKGVHLNYQVKKTSYAGVKSGKPLAHKKTLEGKAIDILYEVPSCLRDPKKKNGELRIPYMRFVADKRTEHLPNGFVIFTKTMFLIEKNLIDAQN